MAVIRAGIHAGCSLFNELSKFIDIPANATAVEIRMAVDEITTVKVTYWPEMKTPNEPVTKRYMLEEIPAAAVRVAGADPLVTHPSGELDKEIVRKAAALAVEQIKQAQRRGVI